MNIKKIGDGLDVAPLLWALQANPQLWNQHQQRTADPTSPHREVDDIWARYADDPDDTGPHDSVWYPAADTLPVRGLVFPLMQYVHGERLGGVLITRIRAGKECKPHRDDGWHAKHYEKFCVQVQSAPGQLFCFDNESLEAKPGDVYWFRNDVTHWVTNPTDHDRISMIVCIRTARGVQ